ncbi:type I-E CRISPR-associated protein Cse1/CasA [Hornefia butyriciproducens]|uniref:type I-E CRISPR-associated protein Cse1/CasA n=1 Tax=Hornefia butyriciproducens TaxID=2652293 RepID=UPI003F88813D
MGKFNLVDEPWISVLEKDNDERKEISLSEFFENTGKYRCLAGEMETQNFAIMRMLLAVIHTVFSRFDVKGAPLPGIVVDDKYVQTRSVDEDDLDEYADAAKENWFRLYSQKAFPEIMNQYLEKQKDRFFLFDDKYPFYQVNPEEMKALTDKCNNDKPTSVLGKNLNRTISESGNVKAFFAPLIEKTIGKTSDKTSTKDLMSEAELARWIITYQGYAGNSDKASIPQKEKQAVSGGWLFDIGGIYLNGKDLYETLVLNYIPVISVEGFIGHPQRPCWEKSGSENVDRICNGAFIDNFAELYTNWIRALHTNPDTNINEPVAVGSIKLPGIVHTSESIEPMTIWEYKEFKSGNGAFVPKKHEAKKSLWRSFGVIAMPSTTDGKEKHLRPRIFDQYELLIQASGERWTDTVGVSLIDNGDPKSLVPVDEICDNFQVNDLILTDENINGWIARINDAVETTKTAISEYEIFLKHIFEIRGIKEKTFKRINNEAEKIYSQIDLDFKAWLTSIEPRSSKDDKVRNWYSYLKKVLTIEAESVFENCSVRDMKGIEKGKRIMNVSTEHSLFMWKLNKIL